MNRLSSQTWMIFLESIEDGISCHPYPRPAGEALRLEDTGDTVENLTDGEEHSWKMQDTWTSTWISDSEYDDLMDSKQASPPVELGLTWKSLDREPGYSLRIQELFALRDNPWINRVKRNKALAMWNGDTECKSA